MFTIQTDDGERAVVGTGGEAQRLAAYVAYTEGIEARVTVGVDTMWRFSPDAPALDLNLTDEQKLLVTKTSDLRDLLVDAESAHEMQWARVKAIVDELSRRAA